MSVPTLTELARLIVATRRAQRQYFEHRTPLCLSEAKAMEAELDRAAAAVLDARVQAGLFDRSGADRS